MAGEKKGEAFEALTYLALEPLGYEIHWGVKPKGFSIKPDIFLGKVESPQYWLLLTSLSSAKEFDKKFWRNTAELFEVKRTFAVPPCVVSFVFEAKQLRGLREAMAKIVDFEVRVEEKEYGAVLLSFIDSLIKQLPSNKFEKLEFIRDSISSNKIALAALNQYRGDIQESFKEEKAEFKELWSYIHQENRKYIKRSARSTFVRRGVAKLMIVPREIRFEFYANVQEEKNISTALPTYLYDLNFVQDSIASTEISDSEIVNLIKLFPSEAIEEMIKDSPLEKMDKWIDPLCNLGNNTSFTQYILQNIKTLSNPEGMKEALLRLHKDPLNGLNADEITGKVSSVWLLYFLFDLEKAYTGRKQSFGRAELAKRAQKYISSKDFSVESTIWGGLGISRFVYRNENYQLPSEVIEATSRVLSDVVREIGIDGIQKALPKIKETIIVSNLEQKLVSFPYFQPLPKLIEILLKRSNIKYRRIQHPSFIGEYLGSPSRVTTPVITVKNTLIHWKSAYDKGKSHKVKELSGRAQALRFQYCNGKFQKREGVDRLILLIDGTFTPKHLETLYKAGWDEIYYPDELDTLVASLKSR